MCDLSKLRSSILQGLVLFSIAFNVIAIEVTKDTNVSVFGGHTKLRSSDEIDFVDFTELGMKIDTSIMNHLSFSGQASYNTIDHDTTLHFAFIEGYWGDWDAQHALRLGILDNGMGIMSAGVHNPSSRSTVVMPRAIYILSQNGIGSSGTGISFESEYQVADLVRFSAEVRFVTDVQTSDSSKVVLLAALVEYPFRPDMSSRIGIETSSGVRLQLETDKLLLHYEYTQYDYRFELEEDYTFNNDMKYQVLGLQYTGSRSSITAELMHGNIDVIRADELVGSEHTYFTFPDVFEGPTIGYHVLGSWDFTDSITGYAGTSVFHYDWNDKEGDSYLGVVRGYPSQVRYNTEYYAGMQYVLNDWMTIRLEHHIMDGFTSNFVNPNKPPSVVDGTWHLTALSLTFGIF